MLIVCPSCASTYTIAAELLGPAGRQVRCAACRTRWFARAGDAGATPSAADPAAARAVPPDDGPPADPVDRFGPHDDAAAPVLVEPPCSAIATAAEPERAPFGARPAASAVEQPPPSTIFPRVKKLRGGLAHVLSRAAGAAVAVVVAAGIGLVAFKRDEVVRRLPGTARLYEAAGVPVNLRGLAFRAVKSELAQDGDSPTLVVEGEIANVTRQAKDVPPVTVAIRSKAGQPLYSWALDPPRQRLEAGAAVPFRSRVAAPPADGHDVFIRFGQPPGRVAEAR